VATGFSLRFASGRVLEVSEGGDPQGSPVFTLAGTPGSRLLYPQHEADAASLPLRLIGYNRPGYGHSTPILGRTIVDAAADVADLADSMGLDKFAVWGFSGGGAHALACAAALPERVLAASSLGGSAPFDAEGLDWLAGTGDSNVEDVRLMLSNQAEWELKSRGDADSLLRGTRAGVYEMFSKLLSDVDNRALTDELIEYLRGQFHEAFEVSPDRMCEDSLASCKPWGFDPASIKVPASGSHRTSPVRKHTLRNEKVT
jgi:pimeloyl-ACP methyl ester carboxylesterase